jgi:hypothetical protein
MYGRLACGEKSVVVSRCSHWTKTAMRGAERGVQNDFFCQHLPAFLQEGIPIVPYANAVHICVESQSRI